MAMATSPDGKVLATGGTEKAIRLWDAQTLQPLGPPAAVAGHTHQIESSRSSKAARRSPPAARTAASSSGTPPPENHSPASGSAAWSA
jgi:WD40 repeat protein